MSVKRVEMGTRQILKLRDAIEKNDKKAFLEAMNFYNPNNACAGDSQLGAAYVKVFREAIDKFILDGENYEK